MKYDKLVRDKIPEIIKEKGKVCKYRIANYEEYVEYLHKKLFEEVGEFQNDPSSEEAADILEVMECLYAVYGFTRSDVERARLDKYVDRGSFYEKIILEEVDD